MAKDDLFGKRDHEDDYFRKQDRELIERMRKASSANEARERTADPGSGTPS